MYIKEYLSKYNDKKIKLFVDMDGVIVDYIFGKPFDYDDKRPLYDSIKKLEEISKQDNIELYILSITKKTIGIEEKNIWLDKYAPMFKKENRVIISKEINVGVESSTLKANYIRSIERDGSVIILIDDDPKILKEVSSLNEDVILLKDTALVD